MTPAELAAIEERAKKATAGPWHYVYEGSRDWVIGVAPDPQGDGNEVATVYDRDRPTDKARDVSAFIAASRTDIPALVAEVRRLTAIVVATNPESMWIHP